MNMKKLIITLIILILWTSKGTSQSLNDSVTLIPNYQLRKAINLIENGKILKRELDLSNERYVLLEYRVSVKDSIIKEFQIKESNWIKIDLNYRSQIENYKRYTTNSQNIFQQQRKRIRGLQLKKWVGILAGVGIGYVIAK